jgi:hypothetical protein
VVIVIATGSKVRGFKCSRAIKIRSTISIGREIMPSALCRKISRYVKDPLRCGGDTDKNQWSFLAHFLPTSLPGASAATKAENSGE